MKKLQPLSFLSLLAILFSASCLPGYCENLLVDPSFEKGGINGPFSDAWHSWGGATTETIYKKDGNYAAKLWGNNTGEWNLSGFFQDVPATAGNWYSATAYVRQNSDDHIRGDNKCYVKLEFYSENLLGDYQSIRTFHSKSESRKFISLSTGRVQAPPGTTVARFVVLYEQDAENSPGAVLIDDVSLQELPQ